MNKSIMFLLGSGISIPAGFPSTTDITDNVMSGNRVIRHTDSRYYLTDSPTEMDIHFTKEKLSDILSLLKIIEQVILSYEKKKTLNYEILFYFVLQLHDFESGNSINMAISPFHKKIKAKFLKKHRKQIRFIDLFAEAENYIRHIVWRKILEVTASNTSYLSIFKDALIDTKIDSINIATLNHDLLLEDYLSQQQISFNDGFGKSKRGVRYWENNFTQKNNFLKLHGSINWFTLQPDHGSWFDQKIGIVLNGDIDHQKDPSGNMMRSQPPEPLILTGTFNKITEYTGSIYSDVYFAYKNLLKNTRYLIVSGYSFGDKGINSAIIEWLFTNKKNKILVIHRDPKRLLKTDARRAIQRIADIAPQNFTNIPKTIQYTSWKEIKKALNI
jgi:hypothetical protein